MAPKIDKEQLKKDLEVIKRNRRNYMKHLKNYRDSNWINEKIQRIKKNHEPFEISHLATKYGVSRQAISQAIKTNNLKYEPSRRKIKGEVL